jgi:hypothetical protein
MREIAAVGAVLALSLCQMAITWLAGFLRVRLGWFSDLGNLVWVVLILFASVGIWFAQLLVYWRIAARNALQNPIALALIIGGPVVGLGIIFYYGIKYGNKGRNSDR